MPEETAISELSLDELQSVCESTESGVRRFIFSKVTNNLVDDLNILVDADASVPASVNIAVDLRLSPLVKEVNATRLVEAAVDLGFRLVEEKTMEILACRSKK